VDVTIAVIPRERFRPLPESLHSLFATIASDVPVLVVDAGTDARTRSELDELQRQRDFERLRSDEFLLPNEARNRALEQVSTRYVAFCDNDLSYSPGWLDALLDNAMTHGAAAVAPVTLIGPSEPAIIHHAGGELSLRTDRQGRQRLRRVHRLGNVRLPDAERSGLDQLALDHDYFEFHCVLIDAERLREAGGLDERYVSHEHIDSALRLKALGGRITFEPRARVMYSAFVPFTDDDWPYFLYRWDNARAQGSNAVFTSHWGVAENSGYSVVHVNRALMTVMPRFWKRIPSWKLRNLLLQRKKRALQQRSAVATSRREPRPAPYPGPDALRAAGVGPASD